MAVVVSTPNRDKEKEDGGTLGGARVSGPDDGPPSSLLEHSQNVVTEPDESVFEVTKCGCDCWYCPDCCERKGYNLRARLIPVLETFTDLMMITLTIDPELFESPREAYLWVKKKRGISRLMRELDQHGHLHTRRYFYVIEFQQETEQAHFHVLVDAVRIPKSAIDSAWSKLRPTAAGPIAQNRPPFGMTRFSVPKFDDGALHAARYATKYLVKSPEAGWPLWVLGMGTDARLPRYQSSRKFWNNPPSEHVSTGKTRELIPRTYGQRITECGTASNVFESTELINELSGEVQPQRIWRGRIELSIDHLAELADDLEAKRPRLTMRAANGRDLLKKLRKAVGQPIRVICGASLGGAT